MHDIDLMLKLQLEGKHDESRAISDKLEALGPDKITDMHGKNTQDIWMRHCFNRGWYLIQDGDYQGGSQLLEYGRFLNVYGSGQLQTAAPIYNPSKHDINGKSIIISLEGGFGDEIIHARFAQSYKQLGADKVYLAAAPELVSVFQRIPGVDGVILRNEANKVPHDYWIPGFSAGWIAGHTFNNFPSHSYIFPKQDSVEVWKNIIKSDKIKVGIRWAGNPKFEHQQFRRFPENFILNLSKYKELELYSLQKDANILDLPEGVNDLQHFLLSWEDTAAAVANLDLVITSCTSIAHMSAAMGKETWVIVPVLPYHTWTPGAPTENKSVYYDSVTLFRQTTAKKWNDTFSELYTALEKRFDLAHTEMPDCDFTARKLNLRCGKNKIEGFHNVDKTDAFKPDEVVDLNKTFPWFDNEFDHIVAKDALEYLDDFISTIKEMYRVSSNGAVWEIQVPHWRSNIALDDPTYKNIITVGMMHLFNKRHLLDRAKAGYSDNYPAFDHDIDIEVCDMNFALTPEWQKRVDDGAITEEELQRALNELNNVAESTRMLIQVHKPGRVTFDEIVNA